MVDFVYRTMKLPPGRREAHELLCEQAGFFNENSSEYLKAIFAKKNDKSFIQSAAATALLGVMLREKGLPEGKLTLRRLENGRPYFERSDLDFSLSHTDNAVMCAVTEKGRIGCDIQCDRNYPQDRLLRLAEFFMTERQLSEFSESADKTDFFYRLWTLKEACLKCAGGNMKTADAVEAETAVFRELDCYCAICLRK